MELESIDRTHLNAYVPKLTSEKGIAGYFRGFLGHRFASTKSAAKSESPVHDIMKLVRREKIACGCGPGEGAGAAHHSQAFRRWRLDSLDRRIDYSSAMVNFYYFYCVDEDFGPFVRYLQNEIRAGRRNVGALKLSNLLQLDRFEEDLNISRVKLHTAPASVARNSGALSDPSSPLSTADQEIPRQEALIALQHFREQVHGPRLP